MIGIGDPQESSPALPFLTFVVDCAWRMGVLVSFIACNGTTLSLYGAFRNLFRNNA